MIPVCSLPLSLQTVILFHVFLDIFHVNVWKSIHSVNRGPMHLLHAFVESPCAFVEFQKVGYNIINNLMWAKYETS